MSGDRIALNMPERFRCFGKTGVTAHIGGGAYGSSSSSSPTAPCCPISKPAMFGSPSSGDDTPETGRGVTKGDEPTSVGVCTPPESEVKSVRCVGALSGDDGEAPIGTSSRAAKDGSDRVIERGDFAAVSTVVGSVVCGGSWWVGMRG